MVKTDLTGRVAVITGGGGGIGSATALRLARAGASVAVVDLLSGPAQATVDAIREEGGTASAFKVDLEQIGQIHRLVADLVAAFGRIDILHNNAVLNDPIIYPQDRKLADVNVEHWDRIFAVNVRAPMLLSKLAIPHMIANGGGVIINMSSGAGIKGLPDMLTAYGCSKGAINTLTLYTAAQYGKQKIRCNALVCNVVLTPSLQRLYTKEQVQEMAEGSLTGRANVAEDIAKFVHFLVSDDAEQITGQLYPI
ncbi:MAG TPA: SDR family oxidoreductase [Steroidobacteraceae bacterium]|nr:SDR family oxidoreductase [Steroidobacteraceae bacterium]